MAIVFEELIEGHLRVVEVCDNGHSVIIGDLPLIPINVGGEGVERVDVGEGVSVRFVNVTTSLGTAEVEVYHVMGDAVAISFVLSVEGCGHDLSRVYADVVKALEGVV